MQTIKLRLTHPRLTGYASRQGLFDPPMGICGEHETIGRIKHVKGNDHAINTFLNKVIQFNASACVVPGLGYDKPNIVPNHHVLSLCRVDFYLQDRRHIAPNWHCFSNTSIALVHFASAFLTVCRDERSSHGKSMILQSCSRHMC